MTNKHCLVFETLGKVSDLKVLENKNDNLIRLQGVFGVCGVRNNNNRIYDKANYKQMVESLQKVIANEGCPGELEHPNSMNINLENVSHKIEDIQMNEDGTITGTIALLNTPKGKIAQAIIEGGLPLFISSRAAGTMTNESGVSHVTLSTIKTYDLVGTPGFSQAKLSLKENQTLECLNESAEENQIWAIVEEKEDDLLGDSGDDKKSEDDKESKDEKESENKKEFEDKKESEDKPKEKENKDNKNNDNVNMEDVMKAIENLTDKVSSLEAQLHVAQESLKTTQDSIPTVDYDSIQKWATEEFAGKLTDDILTEVGKQIKEALSNVDSEVNDKFDEAVNTISTGVQNWIVNEFAPEVQNWVVEEYSPEVQTWITEEFAPEVQNWITEEFAPEVQGWITEEFAPEVQNWITEEFAPVIDGWVNEEFAPSVEEKVNENVSAFLAENKAGRLDEIDSLLETLSDNSNDALNKIVKENENDNKYKGIYVVEHMPAEYIPSWQMLSEERQAEIIHTSRIYDFTKEGVLESFWSSVDFTENKQEEIKEQLDPVSQYQMTIINRMKALRKK